MTRLLKEAFEQASRLGDSEQDAVAQWILDELASERRWDEAFKGAPHALEKLAAEALQEHHAGNTCPLDPDAL